MSESQVDIASTEQPSVSGKAYFALAMLVIVYTLNFIDRQIISILLPSIQAELSIADWQAGLLAGAFFALFYSTLGIPIATIADRGNRRNLIAWALFNWNGKTAFCRMAQNFWQLALARIGVGVGEAGCSPPAHSLISDYFPPAKRATALGIYSLGISLGIMFGLFLGGYIDDLYGWRMAFLIVGLPGVVLAILFRVTVWEPPRGLSESQRVSAAAARPRVIDTMRFLMRRRSFVHAAFGAALAAFTGYSVATFFPTFLARSHGMSSSEIGLWLGLILGLAGGAGIFAGGFFADLFGRADARWKLWTNVVAGLVTVPFSIGVYLVDDVRAALLIFVIPAFLSNFYQATTFAQAQSLVNLRMRGVSAAVLLLVINLVGLGMGPPLTGALSDLLQPTFGNDSMRYALFSLVLVGLWSTFHYWRAGQYLPADLARADDPD
ncbi:MAG: MFS transporter [Pseudomonadota bacterium]